MRGHVRSIENETSATDRLCKSNHAHIVQVLHHGWLLNEWAYSIDMELCDVTLENYIGGSNINGLVPWLQFGAKEKPQHVLNITDQIVNGLIHIHGHGQVHRDLHPSNSNLSCSLGLITVLFDRQTNVWKISDFGFTSNGNPNALAPSEDSRGRPGYRAPELVQDSNKKYNLKADIWSLGCIVFELFIGKKPFTDDIEIASYTDFSNLYCHITNKATDSFTYLKCFHTLLSREPAQRPSAYFLKSMLQDPLNFITSPKLQNITPFLGNPIQSQNICKLVKGLSR